MGGILDDATKYYSEFPSLMPKKYNGGGPVTKDDLPEDAVIHVPGTRHEVGQWYIIPKDSQMQESRKATSVKKLDKIISDTKTGLVQLQLER